MGIYRKEAAGDVRNNPRRVSSRWTPPARVRAAEILDWYLRRMARVRKPRRCGLRVVSVHATDTDDLIRKLTAEDEQYHNRETKQMTRLCDYRLGR